jgi:hypothetical protein
LTGSSGEAGAEAKEVSRAAFVAEHLTEQAQAAA